MKEVDRIDQGGQSEDLYQNSCLLKRKNPRERS